MLNTFSSSFYRWLVSPLAAAFLSFNAANGQREHSVQFHNVTNAAGITPNNPNGYGHGSSLEAAGNLAVNDDHTVAKTLSPPAVLLYTPFEVTLSTKNFYDNSYLDVDVIGVFTSPSGRQLRLDGFWDGGKTWRLRFSPNEPGLWSYSTRSTDPNLVISGTFEAVPSGRRGFVRTSPAWRGYQFEYSDGTPFLLMGDTNWDGMSGGVGFGTRFKPYIDLRVSQHFNAYHTIVVHDRYDYQANEGGAPFKMFDPETRDYNRLNPGFFQWVDRRVAYADSSGMVSILFFTWANELRNMSAAQYKSLALYIVSRYAAYNVFWVLAGDYQAYFYDPPLYRAVGSAVAAADPFDHPISIHPRDGFTNREFGNEAWLSYIMQQLRDAGEFLADSVRDARIYNKPVVNGEYGYHVPASVHPYHGIRQNANYTRTGGWSIFSAGGYFVAGFHHTFYDPNGHYPYDPGFDLPPTHWDLKNPDDLEAARQYGVFNSFFRDQTAWWNLKPHREWVLDGQTELLAKPGVEYVAYNTRGGRMRLRLPAGQYFSLEWFDPIAGVFQPARVFESTGETVLLMPSDTLDAAARLRRAVAPGITPAGNVAGLRSTQPNVRQVRFTWQTPDPADSRIDLQKPDGAHVQFVDNRETTAHDLIVDNLSPNVDYTVIVSSQTADHREWKSAPQNLVTTVQVMDEWVKAESMPVKTAGHAEGPGWNLSANGYIASTLTFPQTGSYRFVVRGRGEYRDNLWPALSLRLDDDQLAAFSVNSAVYKQFTFVADVAAGTHEVKLVFTNDGDDRQLLIDWLRVQYKGIQDTQPPVISNVAAGDVTSSTATIYWTTDEASDSQVEYGLATRYSLSSKLNPARVDSHKVTLPGLEANTTYHYRVKSKDAAGNLAVSGDFTLTTAPVFEVTLEAENMSIKTTGESRPPGWVLWDYGYLAQNVTFPASRRYHFTLRAYGNFAPEEWSQIELRIDQVPQAVIRVNSTTYSDFFAEITVGAGSHEVAIAFTNDYWDPPNDRNLWVDWLRIRSPGPTDKEPPAISNVTASSITSSTATIYWTTNKASDSQVEYGLTTSYGLSSKLNPARVNSHAATLSGLQASTTYHYRVKSRDAAGNLATSGDFTLTTAPLKPAFEVTLEAENLWTKTTGESRPPGWVLWDSGYLAESVTFPASGRYQFTLRAFGNFAAGEWSQAELRIDQVPQAVITVNSTTYSDFFAEITVGAGSHEVAIAFANDYWDPPDDRNLWVDWLRIQSINTRIRAAEEKELATTSLRQATVSTWSLQNYPNQFNAATRISLTLPQDAEIHLAVFDLTGREVKELMAGSRPAGNYETTWNGRNHEGRTLSSGVYMLRLRYRTAASGAWSQLVRRMLMMK